jgi:hypothetical protein
MKQPKSPPGWDAERVRKVLSHYEEQTEDETVAADEAAFEDSTQPVMRCPETAKVSLFSIRDGPGPLTCPCEFQTGRFRKGQRVGGCCRCLY